MDLIQAMRSENAKSKRWYCLRIISNISALALSWGAVYFTYNLFFNLFMFLLPFFSFLCTELSLRRQNIAERIRNHLILMDSLENYRPSNSELKQLQFDVGELDKTEPEFIKPYYDSPLSAGIKRLADNIAECAYFTTNLSRKVFIVYFLATFFILILSVILFYSLLQIGTNITFTKHISQCIALLVTFVSTGDFAFLTMRYFDLCNTATPIIKKAEDFKNQDSPEVVEVMTLLDEYNCAHAQCPPIPSWAYRRYRDKLNTSWRQRY